MCGIVGYAGHRSALDVVMGGLGRLEYRGYDSAGVAVICGGKLAWAKRAGKLGNPVAALAEQPPLGGAVGLGHTRWATHGPPTDPNAHPHVDCADHLAVVHNGIIENFAALRVELEARGHKLTSDTELVAHLLEEQMTAAAQAAVGGAPPPAPPPGALATAMRAVCQRLRGAFTLVAVDVRDPAAVVGARRNSPLVIGRGQGENFLASDVSAFIDYTRDATELGQDQVAEIRAGQVTVTGFDGTPATVRDFHVDWDVAAAEKSGFEAIEHWCRIGCEVELASEFRYREPILTPSTLVIAISQSGETMDTLMAVRHATEQGSRVVAICNVNGSTIPRESDAVVYTHAGPEIAVASTKAFLTQLVACYLLALYLAQVRGSAEPGEIDEMMAQLNLMPAAVARVRTIVIAQEGDSWVAPYADTLIEVPAVPSLLQPLVTTVPLQVFACELATAKGHDVDQPRNLAKSVTVE
jgi:glucosamine--fructose-6-phosphate aminotransferase (isomerizing)